MWPHEKHHSFLFTLAVHGTWQPAQAYATKGVVRVVQEALQWGEVPVSYEAVLSAIAAAAPRSSVMQLVQV
jgi:hypothetical protein